MFTRFKAEKRVFTMKILKKLQQLADEHFIESRNAYPSEPYFRGSFHFGNNLVKYRVSANGKDIEISNPKTGRYYDNIADWLCEHSISFNDIEVEETDEWNGNGFRDEQDYYNWRY